MWWWTQPPPHFIWNLGFVRAMRSGPTVNLLEQLRFKWLHLLHSGLPGILWFSTFPVLSSCTSWTFDTFNKHCYWIAPLTNFMQSLPAHYPSLKWVAWDFQSAILQSVPPASLPSRINLRNLLIVLQHTTDVTNTTARRGGTPSLVLFKFFDFLCIWFLKLK